MIAEPASAIGERATARLNEAEVERDDELVSRTIEAVRAPSGAGALGPSDVARALTRSQVEHLLIDAELKMETSALDDEAREEIEAMKPLPAGRLDEWIAEEAIRTSAAITSLREDPASRLAEHGGVGALLRY